MTIPTSHRVISLMGRRLRAVLLVVLVGLLVAQAPLTALAAAPAGSAKKSAAKSGAPPATRKKSATTPTKKRTSAPAKSVSPAKPATGRKAPAVAAKSSPSAARRKGPAAGGTRVTAPKRVPQKSPGTATIKKKSGGNSKRGAATSARRGKAVRGPASRDARIPSPVTVIRAPGLKLTATDRPKKPASPKPPRVTTVRSASDSTRIVIGGQPHDPRYALFVMPGQELALEAHVAGGLAQKWEGDGSFDPLPPVAAPKKPSVPAQPQVSAPAPTKVKTPRVRVQAPSRTLTWRAPDLAGAAFLTLKAATPAEPGRDGTWKDVARLNIIVMMPAEQMIAGRLNGYLIGSYPTPRTIEDSTYHPPVAFLKSAGRPTRVSPSFFLEDFACRQEHSGERFVALEPRLLPFLEAISARVLELTSGRRTDAANRKPVAGSKPADPNPKTARGAVPAAGEDPSAEAAGGMAAAVAQAHDISDPEAISDQQANAAPRRPNLPNSPAPPPSFKSSPGDALEPAGHPKRLPLDMAQVIKERPIKVLSGYRTPAYNRTLGTAKLSRHQYGDACDIYVDCNNDGRMDDINRDGTVDGRDAITLAAWIEDLWQDPRFRNCPGGLGIYNGNGAHGPFVHVDLRGFKARWGGNGLRWDDESESARDLLGQVDPYGAYPGPEVLADGTTHLADEDAGTAR